MVGIQQLSLVQFRNYHGEGISLIENPENLEEIIKVTKVAENEENALFHTRTIVKRPDGKTMSEDVLRKIINESNETKNPKRNLILKCLIILLFY